MHRSWFFRLFLMVAFCGLSLYILYPSYYFYTQATEKERESNEAFCRSLPKGLPCVKFNLGLDLQGGVQIVMGVRTDKAIEQRADRLAEAMQDSFKEAKLDVAGIERVKGTSNINLRLADNTSNDAAEKLLRKDFSMLTIGKREAKVWSLALSETESQYVRDSALEQAIKTIRNRADKLGVSEPVIARRGVDNVLIQLPGVKDPDRAIDVIGRMAQLEFKIVDEAGSGVFADFQDTQLPVGVTKRQSTFDGPTGPVRETFFEFPEDQKDALFAALQSLVPQDREIGYGPAKTDPISGKALSYRTYLLNARAGITGDYLTDARVQQNPELPSDYYVTMTFDPKGAKIFEKLTSDNVRRHMAIVLDNKVNSAPVIQEKIGGGTARVTLGSMGDVQKKFQEAKDLALVLKAGALPAPVELREKRQVGKTLGQDSVRKASYAFLVGTSLVVLGMLLYYHGSGVIAIIALMLNVLMLLAVLAMFETTLTLPGMAGIVLMIGVAVDANVIIFERIREEMRLGKPPRIAIDNGYDKAFSTIFDSNVTTMIAGIVLMQYGSGPVRGFAVVLIVGILCNMFTSIVGTRVIYDFITSRWRIKTLSI
jgi:preprotein translocase subunit SecD